jgi:hypothetical protein
MTPEQFLALYQPTPRGSGPTGQPKPEPARAAAKQPTEAVKPPAPAVGTRAYRAFQEGANETFLTIHTAKDGMARSLPYAQFTLVSCDERGGTYIRIFGAQLSAELKGRNLAPLNARLRARAVAHVVEFSGGRHDPPDPEQPLILEAVISQRAPPPPARPAPAAPPG